MENQLTSLDIQYLRASLNTKSDGELAATLEVSIETVRAKINEITGGKADERSLRIQKLNEELFKLDQLQENRKRTKKLKSENTRRKRERRELKKESMVSSLKIQQQIMMNRKIRSETGTKKTRVIDYSKLISVRIDHRTHMLVHPGTNIEKFRKMYLEKLKIKI
jgi:uncharacterized protein (DUF39 family)